MLSLFFFNILTWKLYYCEKKKYNNKISDNNNKK